MAKIKKNAIVSFWPMTKQGRSMAGKVLQIPTQPGTGYLIEGVDGQTYVLPADTNGTRIGPAGAQRKREWINRPRQVVTEGEAPTKTLVEPRFKFAQLARLKTPLYEVTVEVLTVHETGYTVVTKEGKEIFCAHDELHQPTSTQMGEYKTKQRTKKSKRPSEKQFVVLYEDGNGGYEIETFAHIEGPSVFHSVKAAKNAIVSSGEKNKVDNAQCDSNLEYFIAELVMPVRLAFITTVTMEVY